MSSLLTVRSRAADDAARGRPHLTRDAAYQLMCGQIRSLAPI